MLLANLHVIGALPSGEPISQTLDRLSEQFDTLGEVDEQVDEQVRDGISSIARLRSP